MRSAGLYQIVLLPALCPVFTAFVLPTSRSARTRNINFETRTILFASDGDVSTIDFSGGSRSEGFDLNTALFCGGLAFDAYLEPPANSSRWERGSKGMNVAFLSQAFTRNLYKGMVEGT